MRDVLKENHPLMSTLNQCCFLKANALQLFKIKHQHHSKISLIGGIFASVVTSAGMMRTAFDEPLTTKKGHFSAKDADMEQNLLCGGSNRPTL